MSDNPLEADHGSSGLFVGFDSADAAVEGLPGLAPLVNAGVNAARGDFDGAGIELLGTGLDALGYVSNPFKGFAAAGLGWLIEHISFLNKPLSLMAGDPGAVADQAQTWTNIGDHVTARVQELRNAVGTLPVEGDARKAYEEAVSAFAKVVEDSAHHAYAAANRTHTAGTLVATTRSLVRDWIAEWAVDRVWHWVARAPLAPATFGAAQAEFITDSVISGARLTNRATDQLRGLVRHLDDLAAAAGKSGDELTRAARALEDVAAGKGVLSAAAKRVADVPGMTRASRFADEAGLATRIDDLAASAKKRLDDTVKADPDVASAAAAQAKAGKKLSERGARGSKSDKRAAHANAAKQHTAARARAGTKAAEAWPSVSQAARAIADDVDDLRKRVAGDKIVTAATDVSTRAAKEVIVQQSNADQRAEKAAEGQVAAEPETWAVPAHPTMGPAPAVEHEEETGPPTPGGAGQPPPPPDPAPEGPQPVKQETWQVRGTLDP